jgi:hypothetical protein
MISGLGASIRSKMIPDLILSPDELAALTGYRRPCDQVRELHRQGFTRARRSPVTGRVILERSHYDAVCRGDVAPQEPRVRIPPRLRAAA